MIPLMEQRIPASRGLTVQEYFRLAEASPTKLEFKNGQIIDMAGATYNHTRIASNIIVALKTRFGGRPCDATGSDTRMQASDDRYCYPDVTVVCGEPAFDPTDSPGMTITNPQMIFEVLSPSTEAVDRGEKFFRYIRLPSMREYFLVAQQRPRIESFVRKEDGSWSVGSIAEGIESTLVVQSLKLELPMREIYANIRFDATP
jgi:Uma2 family endonuclease